MNSIINDLKQQLQDKDDYYNKQLKNQKNENNTILNKNIKEFFQKKKHVIMNKIPNNKPDLKIESNNINKEKKQNTKTLSRNISFNNNSKKIIYAQKK